MPQPVPVAIREVRARGSQREGRQSPDLVLGEVLEPALHPRVASAHDITRHVSPEELSRSPYVPRIDRVIDGAVAVAVRGVPIAGAAVNLALAAGLEMAQLRAEHLAEEPVVPV